MIDTPEFDTDQSFKELFVQFSQTMLAQVERNRHKGMRKVWTAQDLDAQMLRLNISVQELRTALAYGVDVEDKAADCAVWSFMIWDNFTNNPELIGLPPGKRFNP